MGDIPRLLRVEPTQAFGTAVHKVASSGGRQGSGGEQPRERNEDKVELHDSDLESFAPAAEPDATEAPGSDGLDLSV